MGQSRMKGRKVWVRWFCMRQGFFCEDWAGAWFDVLSESGLLGPDFILNAVNEPMDKWLSRPAEYDDFRRVLHAMLIMYAGLSPDVAVGYNPHGFRHVMVTAASQVRLSHHIPDAGLESLGHWAPGSSMPRKYDSEAGVTELATRKLVHDAIRSGWKPAREGELPSSVPGSSNDFSVCGSRACTVSDSENLQPYQCVMVASTTRKRNHLVQKDSGVTVCRWWKCGFDHTTIRADRLGHSFPLCKHCAAFRSTLGGRLECVGVPASDAMRRCGIPLVLRASS